MDGLAMDSITMDSGHFPQLFRKMMATKLRQSLCAVQSSPQSLPSDVRDQALHILSYALKEDALASEATWQITRDLLLALAPRMELMGHRYDWMPFLEKAAEYCQKCEEIADLAEFQLQIALIYRLSNQLDLAQQLAQYSIDNYSIVNQPYNQARALAELAWIAHEQKLFGEADQIVQKAVSLLAIDGRYHPVELGICYRILGAIAVELQNYVDAETNHRKALEIFQKYNDQRRISWSLHNLGLVMNRQQRYLDAIPYFEQAAAYLLQLGDRYYLAHIRFNQGVAYASSQQFPSAISCFEEAATIYSVIGDKFRLSRIQTDLGLAWLAQGEEQLSATAFQISINTSREINDEAWQINAMDGLAMAYIQQEKFAEAIEVLQEAIGFLPRIRMAKNHDYLAHSLQGHLREAKRHIECIR